MSSEHLIDPTHYIGKQPIDDIEGIRRFNAQRFEMEQLTGILDCDKTNALVVGYLETGPDSFWVKGHIPGTPLMPGVLMIEAAAQLCSYLYYCVLAMDEKKFFGFATIKEARFRKQVLPGDTIIIAAKNTKMKSRKISFQTQGFVKDRLVFESAIEAIAMNIAR